MGMVFLKWEHSTDSAYLLTANNTFEEITVNILIGQTKTYYPYFENFNN